MKKTVKDLIKFAAFLLIFSTVNFNLWFNLNLLEWMKIISNAPEKNRKNT